MKIPHVLILVLLLLALLAAPAAGQSPAGATEDVGPPEGAIQILPNGGFEDEASGYAPWAFMGDAYVTQAIAYEGDNCLHLGGVEAWGYARNVFDLDKCDLYGGSIWVWAMYAGVVQPPLLYPGDAVTEGFLTDYRGVSFATLWQRDDQEFEGVAGWRGVWTRVDGLDEILWTDPLVYLYLGGLTGEQSVEFFYDNVEVWCVPAYVVPYMIFLPVVAR